MENGSNPALSKRSLIISQAADASAAIFQPQIFAVIKVSGPSEIFVIPSFQTLEQANW